MEQYQTIETIGSITKFEHLKSQESHILKNTLVLHSVDPFPGVKDVGKGNASFEKPGSVFIILRYRYAPEKINKINLALRNHNLFKCSPSFGEIATNQSQVILPCIRIKNLDDFGMIPLLQEYFQKHDLKLMAYKVIDDVCKIKIFKSFRLIELANGLYRDLNEGEKFYIQIPRTINWRKFDFITRKIKQRSQNKNFDAALGVIYRFCGPEDVIRIYDRDISLKRAIELKSQYQLEIKKDIQITAVHT